MEKIATEKITTPFLIDTCACEMPRRDTRAGTLERVTNADAKARASAGRTEKKEVLRPLRNVEKS